MSCQIAKTEYRKIMIWLSDTKCCHLAIHYVLPKFLPGPNLHIRFMKNCIHTSLLGSLYQIQCLKNGSGKSGPGMLIPFSPSLSNSINSVVCKVPLKVVPPVIKVLLIKSCSGSLSKIETSWTVYSSWISKIWISGNNFFLV